MSSTNTTAPHAREPDVKISLARMGIVLAVLAGTAGLLGAWFVLPYRMDQAERKQEIFETRTERRFEAAEGEARQQREILIRIDENVKQLRRERNSERP